MTRRSATGRRTGGGFRRLVRHTAGATTIEFAFAALPFFLLVCGIIESGLMYWSWQALQGAATDAGRCAALNAPSCGNPSTSTAATQSYAVQAAASRGLSGVSTSNVTVLTGTSAQTQCGGTSANVVSVSMSYKLGLIGFVPLPSNMTASACFPLAS